MTEAADQARRALTALSELTSSSERHTSPGSIPLEWFRWLPAASVSTFRHPVESTSPLLTDAPPRLSEQALAAGVVVGGIPIERHLGDRLAAIDRIRPWQHPIRVGWLFVAGEVVAADGRTRRVFMPLITRPVRVLRASLIGNAILEPIGDIELTGIIEDRQRRADLEQRIEIGGGGLDDVTGISIPAGLLDRLPLLRTFAVDAATAAGIDATSLVPAGDDPEKLRRSKTPVIVAGMAVFAIEETGGLSHAASLRTWSGEPLDRWTAFHACYSDVEPPSSIGATRAQTESPFLLTPVQRSAVEQSRTAPLTVIRGAPGTGKSHTIVAIACDALARDDTVLVAAKSEATVDALIDLFERAPGPRPVVFGSNERKDALATHLAGGLVPSPAPSVEGALRRTAEAQAHRNFLRKSIADRLRLELLFGRSGAIDEARVTWPSLFDPAFDLEQAHRLLEETAPPAPGWFGRRRQRKARRALAVLTGTTVDQDRAALVDALAILESERPVGRFVAEGGLTIGPEWIELLEADDRVRDLVATWLEREGRSSRRMVRGTMSAVAALATALRSGRATRREQLTHLGDELTTALPLWAGTLADIDDLLPSQLGLFDLVILDEASSIDQPTAASALLRGRRGVIVGDPQQLRHVSFLSDEQRDRACAAADIDPGSALASRLDVRRNSVFDVAAASAPVLTLDEHFRCRPHLVDFVSRRIYGGQVRVATRSPATESIDCVDLERVEGERDDKGVVVAEVDAVLAHLRTLHTRGETSVGVVTPFRAQADALERAVLEGLTIDQIEALDLRVGTVHTFQGNERDVVIASLGIGSDADPGSWRFVEDPHLFTVLVTRARERFVIVHSADPPLGGLVAEYFAQADQPPGPPEPGRCHDPWIIDVDRHLQAAGLDTVSTYPTGRHDVDVCVTGEQGFFGVECTVHPDGPEAHIDRHLSLTRRGWELREAYASHWGERRGELIVELTEPQIPPGPTSA